MLLGYGDVLALGDLHSVACGRRINPFNQPNESSASDGAVAPATTADGSMFPVRFLGSQQVLTDRGTSLLPLLLQLFSLLIGYLTGHFV